MLQAVILGTQDHPPERYRKNTAPEHERAAIARALTEAGGARTTAAERLGMSRTTMWRKMKQYGVEGRAPLNGD